jgi:hypothetical protein
MPTTIAIKIWEAAVGDSSPFNLLRQPDDPYPAEAVSDNRGVRPLSPGESTDWGMLYFYFGAAYVLARLENPLGEVEVWNDEAWEAAVKAARWSDSVGGRPNGES